MLECCDVCSFPDITGAIRSRDSSVNIVMGFITKDSGFDLQLGKRFVSSPHHPDFLWSPPSLLANVYCHAFHRGKAARA
jgi:hypothetical protein